VIWVRPASFYSIAAQFPFTQTINRLFDFGKQRKILHSIAKQYPKFRLITLQTSKSPSEFRDTNLNRNWQEVTVRLRDSIPCCKHDSKLARKLEEASKRLITSFVQLLRDENPDRVVIFNGRFLLDSSLWQAANGLSIKVEFLERFSLDWNSRYFIFSKPVHSDEYRASVMRHEFKNSQLTQTSKLELARSWFHQRIFGPGSEFTFNQLEKFEREAQVDKVISFFHSSEDELFSLGLNPVKWSNQFEAIRDLSSILANSLTTQLVIRLHPNLRNKSLREQKRWKEFAESNWPKNVKFIPPESLISSYDLLQKSDKVLTFGSTIGVEATFLGIPSGLLSRALHGSLRVTIPIKDKKELRLFITGKSHSVISKFDLNSYGYFMAKGGYSFKYLNIDETSQRSQDPRFSYGVIPLMNSKILAIIKKTEGFASKSRFVLRSLYCPLDHAPYIHSHVSG
jgi:hypothetical protein